ncbi:MAG: hypothetical protein WDN67_00550 [Candidatus Moraniibacteriota bacterium]
MSRVKLDQPQKRELTVQETRKSLYSYFEYTDKKLLGKVLTFIDAAIPESKQNKAVKDVIKDSFRSAMYDFQRFAFENEVGHVESRSIQLDDVQEETKHF